MGVEECKNSFVSFTDDIYLTDRDCGIVRPFCYPVFNNLDFGFQMWYDVSGGEGEIYFDQTRVSLVETDDTHFSYISDMAFDSNNAGGGINQIYFDFSDSDIMVDWEIGNCYKIKVEWYITPEVGPAGYFTAGISKQCFQRVGDECFTARLTYTNNESAFGFHYQDTWVNNIRLPITFRNPQIKNDQKVYVRSDGTRKKLYARLARQYQGITDMMLEETHQKLIVALSHDYVLFVTDNGYELECTFEDEYDNEFPKELQGANTWNASFNVYETPFDEVNNNCNT